MSPSSEQAVVALLLLALVAIGLAAIRRPSWSSVSSSALVLSIAALGAVVRLALVAPAFVHVNFHASTGRGASSSSARSRRSSDGARRRCCARTP